MPLLSYSLSHPTVISFKVPLLKNNTDDLVPVVSGKGKMQKKTWFIFN